MLKDLITPLVLLVIVVAALFLLPWKMINWGQMTLNSPSQVVVSGYAEADQPNQVASYYLSINAVNADKAKAVEDLTNRTNEVIKSLREFGIPDADMKTQNMNVYQDERYNPTTGASTKGDWRATNSLEVKVKDVAKVQEFSGLVTSLGIDNVSGPNYALESSVMASDALIDKSIANAREKAEKIAAASGKQLGQIVSVQEGSSASGVMPYAMMDRAMGAGGAAPEMMPGTSSVSKSVTVVFELK